MVEGSYGDVNLEKLGCGMGEWLGKMVRLGDSLGMGSGGWKGREVGLMETLKDGDTGGLY